VDDLPLLTQPNAGKPKLVDGKIVFDMSPADFAARCLETGARLVGGCCGTSPDHTCALKELLGEKD